MIIVRANQPLECVYPLLADGHQVLRMTPGRNGKSAYLWDSDAERLRMIMRLYRIAHARVYGEGPWRVQVFGGVLDRMRRSAERFKPVRAR